MTAMDKYQEAKEVLLRSREEVLRELSMCGQNGGSGRAPNYAPILVNINNAIKVIDEINGAAKADFGERMAAARAAKATK